MKIQFCGASTGVTGSCHLDNHGKTQDPSGLRTVPGRKGTGRSELRRPFPFDPAEIECVILSHAHIDHCGRTTAPCKARIQGQTIYCTDATADLLDVMLKDSGYIHEKEARMEKQKELSVRADRWWSRSIRYSDAVDSALKLVKPVLYDQLVELNDGNEDCIQRCRTYTWDRQ